MAPQAYDSRSTLTRPARETLAEIATHCRVALHRFNSGGDATTLAVTLAQIEVLARAALER